MGNEQSKAIARRLHDPAFMRRFFVGHGLDVGAGGDGLGRYTQLFPSLLHVDEWDLPQGDATDLTGVPDGKYGFVHSSHCLEHLADPMRALTNWLRVVEPGGHVIVLIPDWTMYEHELWPSLYNSDHKHAFTLTTIAAWPEAWYKNHALIELPAFLATIPARLVRLALLDTTFLYGRLTEDQTATGIGECAIEFVLQKVAR